MKKSPESSIAAAARSAFYVRVHDQERSAADERQRARSEAQARSLGAARRAAVDTLGEVHAGGFRWTLEWDNISDRVTDIEGGHPGLPGYTFHVETNPTHGPRLYLDLGGDDGRPWLHIASIADLGAALIHKEDLGR